MVVIDMNLREAEERKEIDEIDELYYESYCYILMKVDDRGYGRIKHEINCFRISYLPSMHVFYNNWSG